MLAASEYFAGESIETRLRNGKRYHAICQFLISSSLFVSSVLVLPVISVVRCAVKCRMISSIFSPLVEGYFATGHHPILV